MAKFYYNGVLLPEIPSNVTKPAYDNIFSYQIIVKPTHSGYYGHLDYVLFSSLYPMYCKPEISGSGAITNYWLCTKNLAEYDNTFMEYVAHEFDADTNTWVQSSVTRPYSFVVGQKLIGIFSDEYTDVIWTNYDILEGTYTDSPLYMSKSPNPVFAEEDTTTEENKLLGMAGTERIISNTRSLIDAILPSGGITGQVLTIDSDGKPIWANYTGNTSLSVAEEVES